MPPKLTPAARKRRASNASRARKTYGAGSGRPRKTELRCPCGAYTAATAVKRYHVCAATA
jgi:hypothetical protein